MCHTNRSSIYCPSLLTRVVGLKMPCGCSCHTWFWISIAASCNSVAIYSLPYLRKVSSRETWTQSIPFPVSYSIRCMRTLWLSLQVLAQYLNLATRLEAQVTWSLEKSLEKWLEKRAERPLDNLWKTSQLVAFTSPVSGECPWVTEMRPMAFTSYI